MRLLAYLKLGWGLFKLSRDPEQTEAVFEISSALYALGATATARRKMESDPEARTLIEKRVLLRGFDLQELRKLPEGTLGRVYADHMIQHNLDPNFYPELEIKNDTNYFMLRMRQTHDLWHVLTGFDTSVPGEIGLQAFQAAQTRAPLSAILMGGSLLRAGTDSTEMMEPLMEQMTKGWQRGMKARSIFSLDWEANWSTPLEQLRREYQIEI